jgi:hypothetical protein
MTATLTMPIAPRDSCCHAQDSPCGSKSAKSANTVSTRDSSGSATTTNTTSHFVAMQQVEQKFEQALKVKGNQVRQLTLQVDSLEQQIEDLKKKENDRLRNDQLIKTASKGRLPPVASTGHLSQMASGLAGASPAQSPRTGAARPRQSPMFKKFAERSGRSSDHSSANFNIVDYEAHQNEIKELKIEHEMEKEELNEKIKILEFELSAKSPVHSEIWCGAFGTPADEAASDDHVSQADFHQLKSVHEALAVQYSSVKQQLEAQEHIEFHLREELALLNGSVLNDDDSNDTPVFTPRQSKTMDDHMEFHRRQDERMATQKKDFENSLNRFRYVEDDLTQKLWSADAERTKLKKEVDALKTYVTDVVAKYNKLVSSKNELEEKLEVVKSVAREELVKEEEQIKSLRSEQKELTARLAQADLLYQDLVRLRHFEKSQNLQLESKNQDSQDELKTCKSQSTNSGD